MNTFSTCGEDTIGARHHIETYPVSPQRMGRDDPEFYPRPEDFEDPELFKIPLNLRPRQARLPDSPRLRFDRPFLYMVRHNPTGMILHMGRFNPRLLPWTRTAIPWYRLIQMCFYTPLVLCHEDGDKINSLTDVQYYFNHWSITDQCLKYDKKPWQSRQYKVWDIKAL